jgi:hypothetical protein
MKSRNYLLILLSLTLTGMPALAVDYVACREMLRTKNELYAISKQYEDGETKDNARDLDNKTTKAIVEIDIKCLTKKATFESAMEAAKKEETGVAMRSVENGGKYVMNYYVMGSNYSNCSETEMNNLHKGFTTFGGAKWYKKALKVQADMKKANCPY